MKIEGNLTILVSSERIEISVRDRNAGVKFLSTVINPETFCSMLGRLAEVPVELEVKGLQKVGKTMEIDTLEFCMPSHSYEEQKTVATTEAIKACPDGWIPDTYFGSQDSFFRVGEKEMARCIIKRWV